MAEESKRVAANFYTLNYDLGNGRQIQINGTFYEDQSQEHKNMSLDATVDIVERQRARLAIEMLELRVKQQTKQLADTVDRLTDANERLTKFAGKDKATAIRAEIGQLDVNVRHLRESIAEGQREIVSQKRLVETGVRDAA